MNEQKSFLVDLAETIERHRPRYAPTSSSSGPNRFQHLLRWLLPNGGTLILLALLIATQSVWARNLQAPSAPVPSATTVNYQGRLATPAAVPNSLTPRVSGAR